MDNFAISVSVSATEQAVSVHEFTTEQIVVRNVVFVLYTGRFLMILMTAGFFGNMLPWRLLLPLTNETVLGRPTVNVKLATFIGEQGPFSALAQCARQQVQQ